MAKRHHPPRILILMENHIYPNDVRVQPHAEALTDSGYEVAVISPGGSGFAAREVIHGVKVYRFPASPAGKTVISYFAEFAIATFFLTVMTLWVWARHGMDLLLLYNPPDILWITGLIPRLFGKTVVMDIRDPAPELFKSKFRGAHPALQRILLWMEYLSCRLSDHVITVNESCERIITERNNYPRSRITVIRQGPDTEKIAPVPPDPELRAGAPILIGYLGSLARERGVEYLLRALSHLTQKFEYQNWLCILVGRPDPSQDVMQLARELGIDDRVRLTGFLPQAQWVSILSTTDICIDPGPSNPINDIATTNKMMDYMALAKPMVVFDLPERHVTAGESALYAKLDDEVDMARQIASLIASPELRAQLGVFGRERVVRYLSWQIQRERLLNLFTQLTHRQVQSQQEQYSNP